MSDIDALLERKLQEYGATASTSRPIYADVLNAARRRERRTRFAAFGAMAGILILSVSGLALISRSGDRSNRIVAGDPLSSSAVAPGEIVSQGEWRKISPSSLSARSGASIVFTGDEFLVWGGVGGNGELADGAAYSPALDRWRPLSASLNLAGEGSAAWTGHEMLVVTPDAAAAAYEPSSDRWRQLPPIPFSGGEELAATVVVDGSAIVASVEREQGNAPRVGSINLWSLTKNGRAWQLLDVLDLVDLYPSSIVPAPNGLLAWDSASNQGSQFTVGLGWRTLPPLEPPPGRSITRSYVGVAGGIVTAQAELQDQSSQLMAIATLIDGTWSFGAPRDVGLFGDIRLAPFSDRLLMFGNPMSSSPEPAALIDPVRHDLTTLEGFPNPPSFDQSIGVGNNMILVLGGQSALTDQGLTQTDQGAVLTDAVALWIAR